MPRLDARPRVMDAFGLLIASPRSARSAHWAPLDVTPPRLSRAAPKSGVETRSRASSLRASPESPTNRARRAVFSVSRTRQRNGFRRKAREIDGDAAPRSIERGDARPRALFRVNARRRARASLYAHTVRARVTARAARGVLRRAFRRRRRHRQDRVSRCVFGALARAGSASSARRRVVFAAIVARTKALTFSETLFWSPRFMTRRFEGTPSGQALLDPRARHSATHARARRDVSKNARRRKKDETKNIRHDCLRRRPWS